MIELTLFKSLQKVLSPQDDYYNRRADPSENTRAALFSTTVPHIVLFCNERTFVSLTSIDSDNAGRNAYCAER